APPLGAAARAIRLLADGARAAALDSQRDRSRRRGRDVVARGRSRPRTGALAWPSARRLDQVRGGACGYHRPADDRGARDTAVLARRRPGSILPPAAP